MNWMHRLRPSILACLLLSGFIACQKQTPIEESSPSSLSPSAQTIAVKSLPEEPVNPPAEPVTKENGAESEISKEQADPKDEASKSTGSSESKPSETDESPSDEDPMESEAVKPVPFAEKSSKEKWDLTLKISTYEGCLALFEPDEFLRKKLRKRLYDWFQVTPEEVDAHQRVLLSSDVAFVREFNERRKTCPETYVDYIVQREKACFAYCERLKECGNTGPTGCVSRCESWRSISGIFRQFSCIGLSKCLAVTQCVSGAEKRAKWLKDADTMRRKNQLLNPDPQRKRMLNAITSMVCATEEVRKKPALLVEMMVQHGFNQPGYEATAKRLQSDPTFAADLYDRTRACIPHETPPPWPSVEKPKAKAKDSKSKVSAP